MSEKPTMKLYVWENVLTDYTSGMMVAVASNVDEARARLLEECSYIPDEDLTKEPQVFDLLRSVAFVCWGGG